MVPARQSEIACSMFLTRSMGYSQTSKSFSKDSRDVVLRFSLPASSVMAISIRLPGNFRTWVLPSVSQNLVYFPCCPGCEPPSPCENFADGIIDPAFRQSATLGLGLEICRQLEFGAPFLQSPHDQNTDQGYQPENGNQDDAALWSLGKTLNFTHGLEVKTAVCRGISHSCGTLLSQQQIESAPVCGSPFKR